MTFLKVNNYTVMDTNDSEVEEIAVKRIQKNDFRNDQLK
jgi:hypothetical protein